MLNSKIIGKNRDKVKLYNFDMVKFITHQTKNKHTFAEEVNPKFYVCDKVVYLAGYRSVIEYVDHYKKIQWKNKTLIPISKVAETTYNAEMDNGNNRHYTEYRKYKKAHKLEERLKKYRDEIFYGLVEISPLYCD